MGIVGGKMEKFWIGVLIKREERRVTRNLVGG